jgi:sugar lactone lactonase YvrE
VIAASVVGNDTNTATVTGSPASVARNGTATVTVAYAPGSASGGLWVLNENSTGSANEFVEFGASQLTASGSPTAVAGLLGHRSGGGALAFDRQGNLWASDFTTESINEYTAAQLDSANPTPVLTFQTPSDMSSLAFDSAGNLWTVASGPCDFYEWSAATLASHSGSVTVTPDISILPGCGGPGENPWAIAFDKNWNLWVSDNGNEVIYEYPKDSLKSGFSGLYAARLIHGLQNTEYVAIDATGNLWVTTGNDIDSTYEFSVAQLADTTSAPTPQVALGLSTSGDLEGLAFDNSGNLWLADPSANNVYELTAAQLTTSGTVSPTITISGSSLQSAFNLAFSPHSSGLPLFMHAPPKLNVTARSRRR